MDVAALVIGIVALMVAGLALLLSIGTARRVFATELHDDLRFKEPLSHVQPAAPPPFDQDA